MNNIIRPNNEIYTRLENSTKTSSNKKHEFLDENDKRIQNYFYNNFDVSKASILFFKHRHIKINIYSEFLNMKKEENKSDQNVRDKIMRIFTDNDQDIVSILHKKNKLTVTFEIIFKHYSEKCIFHGLKYAIL